MLFCLEQCGHPPLCARVHTRADWIAQHPHEEGGLWMLKNNKQRGTGLRLVRADEAFAACFETTTRPGLEGVMLYR